MSEFFNSDHAARGPRAPSPTTEASPRNGGASGGAERGFASEAEPEAPPAAPHHASASSSFVARNPDPQTSTAGDEADNAIIDDGPSAWSALPPLARSRQR